MAKTSTIETIWKLILDEQGAKKSEDEIVGLADKAGKLGEQIDKISRQKSLEKLAQDFGAMALEEGKAEEAAIKLNERLKELGATDDEIKGVARSFGEVSQSADSAGSGGGGGGGASSLISKFSGVGRMAGINVEQVAGIARAAEGVQELATAAGVLGTASEAAGVASATAAPGLLASAAGFGAMLLPLLPLIAALGVAALAFGQLQKQTEEANKALQRQYDAEDEIDSFAQSGATLEDALKRQAELQDEVTKATERHNEAEAAAAEDFARRASAPILGDLSARLQDALNLNSTDDKRNQRLEETKTASEEAAAKLAELNKQIKDGAFAASTAKETAKKSASDAEKSAQKQQQTAEKAQQKQQQIQDKAASEAERAAEQQAQKEQQAAEKRYQAGVKYSDALVDIARKAADSANESLQKLRDTTADNQTGFWRDITDLSKNFAASEREEAIKRGEQEVQDATNQTRKLASIRDDALASEQDSLRKRDFLSATKIREGANQKIQEENKAYLQAQADKQAAQKAEDAAQLRALDKARHDRLDALARSNEDAKLAYARDLRNQKESQAIAAREAAIARDRELRQANETARAVLGIKGQQAQAEISLAQHTLNQLRGTTNTTNNTSTVNGGIHFNIPAGAGGMSGTALTNHILSTLGSVGIAQ